MLKSGVYIIKNIITNDTYVGSSSNYKSRWRQHRSELRLNKHKNSLLQEAWNKYGEESFEFKLLTLAPPDLLEQIEQQLIDSLNPAYNINSQVGNIFPEAWKSYRKTEEWKKNKSEQMKELWRNPEFRLKCSKPRNWKEGKPPNLGKKFPLEVREKIRQANLGDKNPNYGKPKSQSFLDKVSGTYNGIVSPEGMVYNSVKNLRSFCREHNLDSGQMCRVINGKAKSHKGWTRIDKDK